MAQNLAGRASYFFSSAQNVGRHTRQHNEPPIIGVEPISCFI